MQKYSVVSTEQITPGTLLLTLQKSEGWKPFTFHAGQYAAISFIHRGRPTAARCFSIVSSPTDIEHLQFTMRTKGHYTGALLDLQPGDTVKVRGPFGGFILDTQRDGDVVLLAGGIGITPFMSMVRYAASIKYSNSVTLIYSCRTQDDIPFLKDLIELEKQNPKFKVVFAIGEGPLDKLVGQGVANGRITPEVIGYTINEKWVNKKFFICGPPPFMRGMLKELSDHGISKSMIKTEAFSQGKNQQTGKVRSWPTNMYAMSAAGLAIGSFVVMTSDMFATLPPSKLIGPKSVTTQKKLTNNREVDLDQLVNSFAATGTDERPTDAARYTGQVASSTPGATTTTVTTPATATSPAQTRTVTTTPTASGGTTTTVSKPTSSTPTSSSPAPTPTPTPTPTPAPTPTPTPTPKPPPACVSTPSAPC